MLKIDRHRIIEEMLKQTGSIIISDVSSTLNCSEETVRRDLKEMEADGILKRIHGGAFLPEDEDKTVPLRLRELYIPKEKDEIAKIVIDNFINENDVIMLDSSTTCLHLAKMLIQSNMNVTIITNSLSIISLFDTKYNNLRLIGIGGRYKNRSHSFVGPKARDSISSYLAAKSFISCSAIDIENGLLDNNENECEIRKTMIKHSKLRYLLVDHTKFSDSGDYIIDNFNNIDSIITDKKPSKNWLDFFTNNNIETLHP
ncbi:MAG: DeoR/GlpR family DNA-binding transcription regulator [Coprobacillus sp.]